MSEHIMPIPSRVYNAAVGGHVAGADQIIDDETGLTLDKVAGGALEEKTYTSGSNNGMGRVVLRKNLVNGVNTLVQTMINKSNTIYIIQYDFTLGENITVPANCIFEFEGGSISNSGANTYTLTGNKTKINEDVAYNIFGNVEVIGFEFSYLDVRWFGAVSDYNESIGVGTDSAFAFERAINHIGKYYNGLHIKLVGQYYIGTSITTKYDVNIWGSHCVSRDQGDSPDKSDISSPSMIAIGDVSAFNMIGRGSVERESKYCHFSFKNIKVVGVGKINSQIFLTYTASGAPGRMAVIDECEFVGLYKCINIVGSLNTVLGDLTIGKCNAYNNRQFIYVVSQNNRSTVCNLIIKDCNIEQNGARAIEILGGFGNVIIDNNLLEGQNDTLRLNSAYCHFVVTNNYFEENRGDYLINCDSDNRSSSITIKNNFIASSNIIYILRGVHLKECDNLKDLQEGSSFDTVIFDCDYRDFNLSYIANSASCCFKPMYGLAKSFNATEINDDVLVFNPGWQAVFYYSLDEYIYLATYLAKGTNSIYGGFYLTGHGNNAKTFVGEGGYMMVIKQKPVYPGSSNIFYFGDPNGSQTKRTSYPVEVKSVYDLCVPSVHHPIESNGISVQGLPIGFQYFNNSTKKTLHWDGTQFVDAMGTPV